MRKNEIKVGGHYLAKVAGHVTTVRVDAISQDNYYYVTNLKTGRKTTFRSAAKFRGEVKPWVGHDDRPTSPASAPDHSVESSSCPFAEPTTSTDATASTTSPTPTEDEQRPDPTSAQSAEPCTTSTTVPTIEEGVVPSPVVPTVEAPASFGDLASRIAAMRTTRAVGDLVAGMTPNDEQEAIIAAAGQDGLRALVVAAGAGTGKTATLKMLEQVLPGRGQYTAFNTSLVAESKAKFVKAACNTTHSLAFRAVGKTYQHRLGGERMRSGQVARILGIESMQVVLKGMGEPEVKECPKCEGHGLIDPETGKGFDEGHKCDMCGGNQKVSIPTDKVKTLYADFLAGQVMQAIRKFCQSADREISVWHFTHIDGIDLPTRDYDRVQRSEHENNDRVREYLLPFARKAWDDLTSVNGELPFAHDVYVKLWQLGAGADRPVIAADYILLDEAQDTAPVFLSILQQQTHALLVLVGDDNQQIYEWRGAVNAMASFRHAPRRMLSQSYRFGQAVADAANAVLATLDEPTDLVMRGNPAIPSRVDVLQPNDVRCYLYRTNAGAVGRVMHEIKASPPRRPHLIGGGADVVAWCRAAMDLQAKRGTKHPELCCFDTWDEVVEYSKTDEGGDLKLMVKLVTDFGALNIHDALKDMPKEDQADVVVSTAHKSKGREWTTVRLGQDFPTANKMTDADRRLLYVAATRAQLVLDISECPPFCGGNDKQDEDNWVPGLRIEYTQPMPSKEEQTTYIAASKNASSMVAAQSDTRNATECNGTNGSNGNDTATTRAEAKERCAAIHASGKYTWANVDGKWCIRGPRGAEIGSRVTVERKNGSTSTETIRSVVRRYPDATAYAV